MTFGQAVREARRRKGLVLRELAPLVPNWRGQPISIVYLSDLENDRRSPSDHILTALCAVLDLDREHMDYLLGRLPADLFTTDATAEQVQAAIAAFRAALRA